MEFFDGAQSWSRVERIIARVEAGAEGPDTRFVVTNLSKRNARGLYEDAPLPARPGRNHQVLEDLSGGGSHVLLQATANQFRRSCMRATYWLMWVTRVDAKAFDVARRPVRHVAPPPRIKIAARVVEMKTMIRVHLLTSCPASDILRSPGDAYRASSHDRRGMRPQHSPTSLQPANPHLSDSGSRLEPTSRAAKRMRSSKKSPEPSPAVRELVKALH